jgi:hypothetical protein
MKNRWRKYTCESWEILRFDLRLLRARINHDSSALIIYFFISVPRRSNMTQNTSVLWSHDYPFLRESLISNSLLMPDLILAFFLSSPGIIFNKALWVIFHFAISSSRRKHCNARQKQYGRSARMMPFSTSGLHIFQEACYFSYSWWRPRK